MASETRSRLGCMGAVRVHDQGDGTCEEVAGGEQVGDPLQWRQHAVQLVRFLVVTQLLHDELVSSSRAAEEDTIEHRADDAVPSSYARRGPHWIIYSRRAACSSARASSDCGGPDVQTLSGLLPSW